MAQAQEHRLREYLLGQLSEAEDEQVELRLLTDPVFAEEYDIVVNEVIDDYVAGKFEGAELLQVEEHFFKSGERRDKLNFALALRQRKSDLSKNTKGLRKSWFRPYLAIAAALLLAVGGGIYLWRTLSHNAEVNNGLTALQAAFRNERPFESRISSLNYAPYVSARGPSDNANIDQDELRRAELTLLEAKKKNPTPSVRYALGKVYLAKKEFDKAIEEFDEVLTVERNNAQLFSDLGAAWLEKGKIDRDGKEPGKAMEELGRSLENISKALELNPAALEALFNRGLSHQYLTLPHEAEADWREYLKKDSTSQWADEARRNLKLLEEQNTLSPRSKLELLNEFHKAYAARSDDRCWQLLGFSRDDLSGTNIFQQLVDAYLDDTASGRLEDAASDLEQIDYVGRLAIRKGNEHYDSEVGRVLKSLARRHLAEVTAARQQMKLGFEAYAQSSPAAVSTFEEAARMFGQSGDHVEVAHARFWIAYCTLEGLGTKRGLAMLTDLAQECGQRNFRWLMMKILQKISSARYNLKEYSAAVDYASHALDLAGQLHDQIGEFDALDVLTELYRAINNHPQALNSLSRSQPLVDCCAFNPIKLQRHYGIAAFTLYSAGLQAAAIDSEQEALRRALETGETSMICVSYANLGLMLGKAGKYDDGLKDIELAYDVATTHSSEPRGKEMMAYSMLQRGHLYRDAGQYSNAVQSYDDSIKMYESLRFPLQLYQAHKGRLFCYIKQAQNDLASEELDRVLSLIDANRSTIFEGDNRNKFFDLEQSVYDLGIAFTFEQMADEQKAFAIAEDSRARSLLDLMLRGAQKTSLTEDSVSRPLLWTDIKDRLPVNTQIVEYSVLPDRVVMWVLNQAGLRARQSKIGQTELAEKIRRYTDSITDPTNSPDSEVAKELFSYLIQPVEDLLDKQKQMVIVPDKSLSGLPFGALVSPTNQYLIQDYCISYSPSATVYILKSTQAREMNSGRAETLLSVGNPTFDHGEFPTLVDLPAAEREARQVAADYDHARLLLGPNATKRNLTTAMPDSTVVHLALHALEDENSESYSRMVLARESSAAASDESGTLTADEIYGLRLQHTRLVVLSACQTGTGRYYRGEGTFSLARAFLVSGVPLVVASLWAVESESTAGLMIKFHGYRTQDHYSSSRALQKAQLDMIDSTDQRFRHPYFWAPFVIQGGYAAL